MPIPITRLNHAVLFVRDVDRAAAFYRDVFGFEEMERPPGMRAAFMRSPIGGNHHDLGLFEVGRTRRSRRAARWGSTTWPGRCETIEDLATAAAASRDAGALTGAATTA